MNTRTRPAFAASDRRKGRVWFTVLAILMMVVPVPIALFGTLFLIMAGVMAYGDGPSPPGLDFWIPYAIFLCLLDVGALVVVAGGLILLLWVWVFGRRQG